MSKILCVLDGFGLLPESDNNPTSMAKMPNLKYLLNNYFWTTLNADGESVGQEAGLVGNSEVGHMNIGGLKLVPQLSYQITKSAENNYNLDENIAPNQLFDPKKFLEKKFHTSPTLLSEGQLKGSKTVHLVGLFSTGSIHSDLRHWVGAIESAGHSGAEKIVLHLISDGRDCDRQSLVATWGYFIKKFQAKLKPFKDKIYLGSLGGRFYGMDRDNNWERVIEGMSGMFDFAELRDSAEYFKLKYNLEIQKFLRSSETPKMIEIKFDDILNQLDNLTLESYNTGQFDETITPLGFSYFGTNDTVWLLNFRTDRMKEMSQMLCEINSHFNLNLTILANNSYGIKQEIYLDKNLDISNKILPKNTLETDYKEGNYYPIFKNESVKGTLAEYISKLGKSQLHIAETEKFNHVTYFLNGGKDIKWPGEDWVVIDSNKVASHAELPEMKAKEVTDYILDNGLGKYDYIVVNYANPDMIGHTGDVPAAIKTLEFLDHQLGRLIKACQDGGHSLIITADHGNIEKVGAYTQDGILLTDTEHNPNCVPLILVDNKFKKGLGTLLDKNIIKQFMQDVHNLEHCNIQFNKAELEQMLNQINQVDLKELQWLKQEQIPSPILPLWYAGLVFITD